LATVQAPRRPLTDPDQSVSDRVARGRAAAAYLGSGDVFDQVLAEFAEAYADQNDRDYRTLRDAVDSRVDSRRVTAQTGL
jgi:hypothetical protein